MAEHAGIEYLYEEPPLAQVTANQTDLDSRARLLLLDPAVIGELRQILIKGDIGAASKIAARIRATDAELAAELQVAIDDYRFEDILNLIETSTK